MRIWVAISWAVPGGVAFRQSGGGLRRSRLGRRADVLAAVVARTTSTAAAAAAFPAVATLSTVTATVATVTAAIAAGSFPATAITTSAFAAIFTWSAAAFLRAPRIVRAGLARSGPAPSIVGTAFISGAVCTAPVSASRSGRAIIVAGTAAMSAAPSRFAGLHVAIDDRADGFGPRGNVLFTSRIFAGVIAEIDEIIAVIDDGCRLAGGAWSFFATALAVFRFFAAWLSFASRFVAVTAGFAASAASAATSAAIPVA